MFRPVLRTTLLAAGILLGAQAAFAENRLALVIGQSAYRAVTRCPIRPTTPRPWPNCSAMPGSK